MQTIRQVIIFKYATELLSRLTISQSDPVHSELCAGLIGLFSLCEPGCMQGAAAQVSLLVGLEHEEAAVGAIVCGVDGLQVWHDDSRLVGNAAQGPPLCQVGLAV